MVMFPRCQACGGPVGQVKDAYGKTFLSCFNCTWTQDRPEPTGDFWEQQKREVVLERMRAARHEFSFRVVTFAVFIGLVIAFGFYLISTFKK